jgi:hypothetical protein
MQKEDGAAKRKSAKRQKEKEKSGRGQKHGKKNGVLAGGLCFFLTWLQCGAGALLRGSSELMKAPSNTLMLIGEWLC